MRSSSSSLFWGGYEKKYSWVYQEKFILEKNTSGASSKNWFRGGLGGGEGAGSSSMRMGTRRDEAWGTSGSDSDPESESDSESESESESTGSVSDPESSGGGRFLQSGKGGGEAAE